MNPLQEAILRTVAYYDLQDFPLTAQEILLSMPPTDPPARLEDVESALDGTDVRTRLGRLDGFYFLQGREGIVETRRHRYDLAEGKFRRAVRFFRAARFVPFLRAAFICNTLARSNAREDSDIDLLVVAAPGRVWTTRLLVSGLASLLGLRRTGTRITDRLCLSFFLTERSLDLRTLALPDDVYLVHWLREIYPVYDEAGVAERLFASNGWAASAFGRFGPPAASERRSVRPAGAFKRGLERFLDETVGAAFEKAARALQMRSISGKWREQSERSVGVVVNDDVLKFHERDRRAEIRDRYRAKLSEYGLES